MRFIEDLILASASPRRLEILRSLGWIVHARPAGTAESARPSMTPQAFAEHCAAEKADAAMLARPEHLVVTADTVVDLDGVSLGKPQGEAEALSMLSSLSGRTHVVHTAFVAYDPQSDRRIARTSSTGVTFYPADAETLRRYVATGEPFDKAGAYGIQGLGAALVERIDGDFYTVMGFPLALFVRSLREMGLEPAPAAREAVGAGA